MPKKKKQRDPHVYDTVVEETNAGPTPPASAASDTVQMYSPSGEALNVRADQAGALFASGKAGFAKGQKVGVQFVGDQTGDVKLVDADQVKQALSSGFQIAGTSAVSKAATEREQQGIHKTAEAAGAAAARGLTFGLSDQAIVAGAEALGDAQTAEKARTELRNLQEHHQVASIAGEVAGAAAPIIASGGAGLLGRGALGATLRTAGVMPRAVSAIGSAAEHGAAALVGTGAKSMLGRVAQRAIPMAAQGAAEGAFYGAGHEVSEAALGDHELNAEKLLVAAAHGMTVGGLAGGALGAASGVLSKAKDSVLDMASKADVEGFFKNVARNRALKAIGATERDVANLPSVAGDLTKAEARGQEIVDTLLSHRLNDGEAIVSPLSNTEKIAKNLQTAVKETDEHIAQFRNIASKKMEQIPEDPILRVMQAPDGAPSLLSAKEVARSALKRIREEVTNEMFASLDPIGSKEARRILSRYSKLENIVASPKSTLTLNDIGKLNDQIASDINPMKYSRLTRAGMEKTNRILREEIDNATQRALGPEADKFARLRMDNTNLREAFDMTSAASSPGFNALLAGGAGAALGIGRGTTTSLMHHLVKGYGNQALAVGADRMAKYAAIRKSTMAVDRELDSAIQSLLEGSPKTFVTAGAPAEGSSAVAFDPQAHAEQLGTIAKHAPNTAVTIAAKAANTAAYLKSQTPEKPPLASLTPQLERARIPKAAQAKFDRTQKVIAKPLSVLQRRPTLEEMAGLRASMPRFVEDMQNRVWNALTKVDKPLPYKTRLHLSALLETPDPTLSPQVRGSVYKMYQNAEQSNNNHMPSGSGGGTVSRSIKLTSTAVQNLLKGDD